MKHVLIVSEDAETLARWARALTAADHRVEFCSGPSMNPCPRVGVGPCRLRESVDAAVVEIQRPGGLPYGEWGEHACTPLDGAATTIYVCDADGPTGYGRRLIHPVSDDALIRSIDDVLAPAEDRSLSRSR